MRLTVVIPSRNGGAILAKHLPAVAAQAAQLPGGAEVIVVDDASDLPADSTAEAVAAAGEPVRLLCESVHRGFAGTCNAGAATASGEFVFFLNNDMHPGAGCLATLCDALARRPDVFAISPVIENLAGGFPESSTRVRLRRGLFDVAFPGRAGEAPAAAGEARGIAYACGGALICRRDEFLALGGFCELYAPFYWEDADLGWRAQRLGRAALEWGDARAQHDHAQTIGSSFSLRRVRTIYERNRLLFTWLHTCGVPAWTAHLTWLGPRWIGAALRLKPAAAALPLALTQLRHVVRERARLRATRRAAAQLCADIASTGDAGWPQRDVGGR